MTMFFRLLLLFTLVPLLELFLLLRIGAAIGVLPTVGIVIGTGLLGAGLARREGVRAWTAVQTELEAGRVPAAELVHGLLVLIAGALLVTPGVVTDVVGFGLLARPIRIRLIRWLHRRFTGRIQVGGVEVGALSDGPFGWPGARGAGGDPREAGGDRDPPGAASDDATRQGGAERRANDSARPGRVIDI